MGAVDEDRIQGRLDEDQEALVAAAAPHGFELRQPRKRPLEDYGLKAFEGADTVLTRLTGEVSGAKVDIFEYDWVQSGAKGAVHRGRRIALVLRHPAFEGEARCTWEPIQTLLGKLLVYPLLAFFAVTLFWLIIPIWLIQYAKGQSPFARDWRVGHPEFDKRFKVQAATHDAAKRALPLALQELVVAGGMKGPIEVRPGMLAVGLDEARFDPSTFERTVALAKRLVEIHAPPAEPAVAYRIASDRTPAVEPAAAADDEQEAAGAGHAAKRP